jgi:hypothetical protein
MRKGLGAIVSAGGAVALVIGLAASPSFATNVTTWSVAPGGSWTGIQSGHFTLADTTAGNSLVCTHTKAAGSFKSGHGLPGAGIGSITSVSFTSCTGPSGLTFTMTAGNLPWALNAVSYDPAITSGTTTGTVSGIHATISGRRCHATVDGTSGTANDGQTEIHFHNSLSKLTIRTQLSNLHLYGVTGCLSLIKSGDAVTFHSAYKVSPAQTITAP